MDDKTMTRKEMIHIFENSRLVSDHFTQEAVTATYVEALAALCARGDAENVALTLEELRGMDGQPVWCAELECGGIISVEIDGRWKDIPFLRGRLGRVDFEYEIEKRGLTLYRRPPEKEK